MTVSFLAFAYTRREGEAGLPLEVGKLSVLASRNFKCSYLRAPQTIRGDTDSRLWLQRDLINGLNPLIPSCRLQRGPFIKMLRQLLVSLELTFADTKVDIVQTRTRQTPGRQQPSRYPSPSEQPPQCR